MKKITLSAFLLMGCLYANAQTITQSTSLEILDSNMVSCNGSGLATADNSYYRYFKLAADHGITEDYHITSVQFAIEQLAHETVGSQPIIVKLYAATATFPTGFSTLAGYTLLANQTFDVPDQELGTYTANIAGTVPAGSDLVVEISYLGDENGTFILFLGSNDAGESKPTYIMAADCNITSPQTIAVATGISTIHLIMSVVGTTDTAGLNENIIDSLSVYPNPTNGVVTIQTPGSVSLTDVTVTDVAGKVAQANVSGNTVNMSEYASGVYFMNITTDSGKVTKKIVKQ